MARVFVITGPSGVGKGTLIRTLLERIPELELSVSATTRKPRPGEEDGVDYHFLDDAEFERRVQAGDFVEHAAYSGRRYGTLRSELDRRTARRRPGRARDRGPGRAPDPRGRCPRRCASSSPRRPRRRCATGSSGAAPTTPSRSRRACATAHEELAAQGEFPHVVVNDRLDDAVEALEEVVRAIARIRGPNS